MMMLPLFSFFATVAGLWALLRSGFATYLAMDSPNHRSLHVVPVPRIGGIVLVPTFLLAWVWLPERDIVLVVLVALLALLSYLDDRAGLPIALRLVGQLVVAVLFVLLKLDFPAIGWGVGAVLWIVWGANLYNFMDGADGIAGGMALFGFSVYGLAALSMGNQNFAIACFSIASASAGFLLFNFYPAKTFMGDSGSISLGFLAGALGLLGWRSALWPVWFPVLVFSPFIVDATVTLLKRLSRGERIWQAHHEHYYQRLVRMGWTHRRLALFEYGLMVISGVLALVLLNSVELVKYIGLLVWVSIYAAAIIWIDLCWTKHLNKTSQP
jgi:UDP-N-acetylmuramyl pentapeptide phosphotransferase/UDP-N-acetylglucosamine-1-phosphate transferase